MNNENRLTDLNVQEMCPNTSTGYTEDQTKVLVADASSMSSMKCWRLNNESVDANTTNKQPDHIVSTNNHQEDDKALVASSSKEEKVVDDVDASEEDDEL